MSYTKHDLGFAYIAGAILGCSLLYLGFVLFSERPCEKENNVYDCQMVFVPVFSDIEVKHAD